MSTEKQEMERFMKTVSTWREASTTPVSPVTSTFSRMGNTSPMEETLLSSPSESSGKDSTPSAGGEEGSRVSIPITSRSLTGGKPRDIFEESRETLASRNLAYGYFRQHWSIQIGMLNALLKPYLKYPLPVEMWPKIMITEKLARSVAGEYIHDQPLDIVGYAALWSRLEEENPEVG